jgi:hypothetical protein
MTFTANHSGSRRVKIIIGFANDRIRRENNMSNEVLFAITMIVLAVLLFGSVLLYRRGRERAMDSPVGDPSYQLRDCYDACADDPKRELSRACTTDCLSYGGA